MNKSSLKFVNLHCHSSIGSPFDALNMPNEHIDFCLENGMDAMALTDHGNMNGYSYQLLYSKELKRKGIKFKPIFGVEAYYIDCVKEWREEYEKGKLDKKLKKELEKEQKGIIFEEENRQVQGKIYGNAHFLLLAKNQTGLTNLFKIISSSNDLDEDYFFRKPRIDYELLKRYSEGLIATTTCISGPFAKLVWNNPELSEDELVELMKPYLEKFIDIFGKENYFVELQWNGIPEQHILNKCKIRLSKEYSLKCISTVDVHYARPEYWKAREIYKRLGFLGYTNVPEWISRKIPDTVEEMEYELYPKNGDQCFQDYKKYSKRCGVEYDDEFIKQSIENTYKIAHELIEDFEPNVEVCLPSFVVPDGMTADEKLYKLCTRNLKLKNYPQEKYNIYAKRLLHELKVVKNRGFSKYFLVMEKAAYEIKKRNLSDPGRGSSPGSLIAYLLDITQIDPIKWELMFSRFLREDATDYPDIDFDCSDASEMKKMLIDKWGKNNVVLISNWNTLKLKSLIKDLSKLYEIPFEEVNIVTGKMIKEATNLAKKDHGITAGVYEPTWEEVLKYSETLQNYLKKYPHISEHVSILLGQIRSKSVHAGGVIIGENLNERMPLIRSKGTMQTPFSEGQNVRHLEPLGFIKFDILGISSLKMIEQCISHILKRHFHINEPTFEDILKYYNENLHPDVLDFDDQTVYKHVYHDGKWPGIFQFTETNAQDFCMRFKPKSIVDTAIITSVQRPGPMGDSVPEHILEAKKHPHTIKYIHPIHKEITEKTYGFLVFQEQIALLAHKLGKNVSEDEGNLLRKLLTKKGLDSKKHEQKLSIYKKFIEGCIEKNIDKELAERQWKTFEYFSSYGFNRCVSGDTKFYKNDTLTIKEMFESENNEYGYAYSMNNDLQLIKNKIVNIYYSGKRQVYLVTTESGLKIKCTNNHKFPTTSGEKELQNISENDCLYVRRDNFITAIEKIFTIEYIGKEDVYDVEMNTPYHTWTTDTGIVTCNSHAISYSMLSYQCAYLFTYYPHEWLAAFLDKEPETKKEKAINIINKLGYEINNVDINKSGLVWEITDDNKLVQPLTSIKGLGEKAVSEIIKHKPFHSIEELMFNPEIDYRRLNKKSIDVLVRSGALNNLKTDVYSNQQHFWLSLTDPKPKTLKELNDNINEHKNVRDFTINEKIGNIVGLTGRFPFDLIINRKLLNFLESERIFPIGEFNKNNSVDVVWCIPRSIQEKRTSKGKKYWIVNCIDPTGGEEEIKCWGINSRDRLDLNKPILIEVDYDPQWGFSTRKLRDSVRYLNKL